MRLEGRQVVITGAGSGIGRAIAVQCAAEGARVVVGDIDPIGGRATVTQIEQAGGRARFVETDVTRAEDAKRLVKVALSETGRLDALVNNAARGGGDDILKTEEAEWDRIM